VFNFFFENALKKSVPKMLNVNSGRFDSQTKVLLKFWTEIIVNY